MTRRRTDWLAALGLVALLSGCLLGPQDHPEVIPDPLPAPRAQASPSASGSPSRAGMVTVYLVREDRLAAAPRPAGTAPDRLTAALQALVLPPAPAEGSAGLRSALPADTPELVWRDGGAGVLVALPAPIDQLSAREQLIAIGQVVYTVTENSDADRVAFTRENGEVDVPDGAGRLLSRPVTRSDYRQIAPR